MSSDTIELPIPKRLTPLQMALTFSAYLQGDLAIKLPYDNDREEGRGGPFRMTSQEASWVLDATNNFWMHVFEGKLLLVCRHPHRERETLEAMAALFRARHLTDPFAGETPST